MPLRIAASDPVVGTMCGFCEQCYYRGNMPNFLEILACGGHQLRFLCFGSAMVRAGMVRADMVRSSEARV